VALNPPAPLRSNSLLIVRPDDPVALLADAEALERFFRSTLPAATTAAMATEAAKAWLRLVEELNQDGFLQFAVADESITVAPVASGGQRVTGEAVVVPKGGSSGLRLERHACQRVGDRPDQARHPADLPSD
jgi:hypothetical protein